MTLQTRILGPVDFFPWRHIKLLQLSLSGPAVFRSVPIHHGHLLITPWTCSCPKTLGRKNLINCAAKEGCQASQLSLRKRRVC